ncbi:MAG: MAPEG family protein [Pseudomonadaceae bacterium]
MTANLIFLPVLAHMALVFWLYIALTRAKERAQAAGQVDEARRALHDDAWPESVQQINNCIRNQFELPVLFYALALVLWSVGAAGVLAQALAWLFLVTRLVHAWIHVGSNYVPARRRAFTVGVLALMAMTLVALAGVFGA